MDLCEMQHAVSILVFMEGHRRVGRGGPARRVHAVSILVFMEGHRRVARRLICVFPGIVSILVFMEGHRRVFRTNFLRANTAGFNPCFYGRSS